MNLLKALSNPIFSEVLAAAKTNKQSAYVVGGFVRDYILGRKSKNDIDFVTEGDGILLAKMLSNSLKNKPNVSVFKRFGTAMISYDGMQLEFVGARKESYTEDSRKPSVEKGSLQDDQLRRDFTINAMAISLNEKNYGELLDPFDGIRDLEAKIIRTPTNPDITYSDDPLRMLRAIRFSSQLGFTIEKKSFDAIKKNAERVRILSLERITDELNKIMLCEKPSAAFILLEKSGLLQYILPEITNLKGIEEIDGHKHKDNFYHSLEVLDNICQNTDKLWLRWAALLHDVGKAETKILDPKLGWTFHMHEFVGSKMVKRIFFRLKLPMGQSMKYVQKIVKLSSRPIALVADGVSDSAVRRLLFEAGEDFDDLMTLCRADITTKNTNRLQRYLKNFDVVEEKAKEIEEKDRVRNFSPPVTGELIMSTFQLKPCKEVGEIKNKIKEAILEGDISNEYEQAFAYMLELGEKMNLKK